MRRTTVLLAVAMLVVAGVPATAAFAQESSSEQPGATFAGVVGVQGAEVEGEVAQRSLDRRLANADSNSSKAAVVAGETEEARRQLSALRERRETLEQRYESGEITRGEYRSRLAQIGAQIRTLERRLNATAAAAEGIPEETLRDRGVNASEIAELRRNASEMGGGEVAEAARGIGGADTGQGLTGDPGPPENAGPPSDAGPPGSSGNGTGGPPADAGPDDGGNGEDRGEGAAGPPDDRGNANRTTGAGAGAENGTDGGPPGARGDTNGSDDRGNAGDAADGANGSENASDGSAGSADTGNGSGDAGDGTGSENADTGSGSENAGDGSGNESGDDETRGNGTGSSDDGTATPTETPEDDGDRRVDDGRYLTLR
ncbi:hypothetical protein GRX01_02105 [Halobaculum sp. WSA2]|uniref:Uncharacterized protein n=1 Tax=Halobaculum saliterrae TaxID=2073113 RepID=A0A6B0SU68_9EURY|nr:hypothetical protein [Halobaculum saliterrae]MXR40153.1 hypothetical protein [Halobaculum saliterrae]